ncbi:MAG: hypothetical protein H7Y20_08825 [Bryobacteraceae bacterium]|nr:hypothetical protein [Bryobacteraceae bacterium]
MSWCAKVPGTTTDVQNIRNGTKARKQQPIERCQQTRMKMVAPVLPAKTGD